MADNTTQVSEQINSAVNSALGVGALAAIYTGNFVNFGKEGGALALIAKTITENGVYRAASDGADGYSVVTVNVGGIDILSGIAVPDDSIGDNGQIYLHHVPIVEDVTFLDAVNCNVAAYADSGIAANTDGLEIDTIIKLNAIGSQTVFGARFQSMTGFDFLNRNGSEFVWRTNGGEGIAPATASANNKYHIIARNNYININGSVSTSIGGESSNVSDTVLLGFSRGGSYILTGTIGHTIFRGDDGLLADLWPAKDTDDRVGFYNSVNGEFIYSATSTDFLAGSEIGSEILNAYVKKDGSWIDLIGALITDVNLGGE